MDENNIQNNLPNVIFYEVKQNVRMLKLLILPLEFHKQERDFRSEHTRRRKLNEEKKRNGGEEEEGEGVAVLSTSVKVTPDNCASYPFPCAVLGSILLRPTESYPSPFLASNDEGNILLHVITKSCIK